MLQAVKILVVKRDALGDVISVTPFLEVLRRTFPKARISYLVGTWSQAVLKNNPHINEIIAVDSSAWQNPVKKIFEREKLIRRLRPCEFDTVFILQGPAPFHFWENFAWRLGAKNRIGFKEKNQTSSFTASLELPTVRDHIFKYLTKNRAEHYLDLLRTIGIVNTVNSGNRLYGTENDLRWADDFWHQKKLSRKKVISLAPGGAINPGMKQLAKRWPISRYAETINFFGQNPSIRFLLLGGPSDLTVITQLLSRLDRSLQNSVINLAGKTSIHQTATLIKKSLLFIGNDSGTIHIASTTSTPIIGLYGPTNPAVDGPYKVQGINIFHKTKFSPCYSISCQGHSPCINNITTREVCNAASEFLKIDLPIIFKQCPS